MTSEEKKISEDAVVAVLTYLQYKNDPAFREALSDAYKYAEDEGIYSEADYLQRPYPGIRYDQITTLRKAKSDAEYHNRLMQATDNYIKELEIKKGRN